MSADHGRRPESRQSGGQAVDTFSTAAIWISIGVGLILLIKEQSIRLEGYKRQVAEQKQALCDEIREVCNDQQPVDFYLQQADRIPDNLVYFALAETRQQLASIGQHGDAGDVFAKTLTQLAADNGFALGNATGAAFSESVAGSNAPAPTNATA
jgi:hypothetical protein